MIISDRIPKAFQVRRAAHDRLMRNPSGFFRIWMVLFFFIGGQQLMNTLSILYFEQPLPPSVALFNGVLILLFLPFAQLLFFIPHSFYCNGTLDFRQNLRLVFTRYIKLIGIILLRTLIPALPFVFAIPLFLLLFPAFESIQQLTPLFALLFILLTILLIGFQVYLTFSFYILPYIFHDAPGLPIIALFRQSYRMMNGHRFRLFRLMFSFIGWMFLVVLCMIPFTIFIAKHPLWIPLLFGAFFSIVFVYITTSCAAFYEDLKARQLLQYGPLEEPEN